MKKYLQYYWLEKEYLEKEVYDHFDEKGFLTAIQFFTIIRWKAPGLGAEPIRLGLKRQNSSLDVAVRDLTERISRASTKEDRLAILLEQDGFQLAMASAVLTILYPDDFSVYDWRVRSQLKHPRISGRIFPDITYAPNRIRRYFDEYVKQVKDSEPKLLLRDCDRALWAKSWLESLHKLISK